MTSWSLVHVIFYTHSVDPKSPDLARHEFNKMLDTFLVHVACCAGEWMRERGSWEDPSSSFTCFLSCRVNKTCQTTSSRANMRSYLQKIWGKQTWWPLQGHTPSIPAAAYTSTLFAQILSHQHRCANFKTFIWLIFRVKNKLESNASAQMMHLFNQKWR